MPLDEPPGVRRVSNGLRVRAGSPPPKHTVTGLADQHRAALPQRAHAGRVGYRLMAFEQFAAELGRHVIGLHQVFDADRHAVDGAQRLTGLVSDTGFVGGLARPVEIEKGERHYGGLERLDSLDTALEISARRVCTAAELGDHAVETQHPMRCRIVGSRRRLLVDVRHQISFDVTGSPSRTCPATSKFTNCDCTCWVTA